MGIFDPAALAANFQFRAMPDTGAELFAKLDYEPNCAVRFAAREAGTPEHLLPVSCGQCPQELFHAATEFDVLYGGAAGGGKTKALLMEGVRYAVKYPGLRIGAFRESYRQLEQSLLTELALIGFAKAVGGVYNGSTHELRFSNSSVMMFQYASNMKDATSYQGGQYQLLLFDERTLLDPLVPPFLESRLRSGRADVPVIGVRSGTNPGGPGHGAVKERFIVATDHGAKTITDKQGRSVRFIPSKVTDNPHLDANYTKQLDALPEEQRKAFRDGSWDIFAGQVFTEWRHDRHVVPRFQIPAEWNRYAGIDWGYAKPWAVVWAAVDEDDRAWIYREQYGVQVFESDQAKRIVAAEAGEPIVARYADDAMWTGRGEAKSVAEMYAENGCDIVPAHKGERITGWQRVHSYLQDGPACLHHRNEGWETCPRLHVLDGTAPELVRTLPALPYDSTPSRMEDVDTKAEDHAPDALRYLLINIAEPTITGWLDGNTHDVSHAVFNPTAAPPSWWQTEEADDGWDSGHAFYDPNHL